ncbi:hypothetical protein SAY86_023565 [Trapa natans]|uniref:Fe-S metabolism associated domain-containing protein n=1 Tax=Trapa natans TaxID=22666 RepID=A0AAN7R9F8_TRANT|nr:hypothetical protein SAY86_023565 [Trapa natans]
MASGIPTEIPCPSSSLRFRFSSIPSRDTRVFLRPGEYGGGPKRIRLNLSLKVSRRRASVWQTLQSSTVPCGLSAAEKLDVLVSEFRALTGPIDRVKRLLHYAAILPDFEESARVHSNRVTGCTTQVWLDVGFENQTSSGGGRMRFRADSDSEITKGFCSCLIWVLDGAYPEEVMAVRAEDLGPMNMGLVAHSRVSTWHNVLVSMQKRTKGLAMMVNGDEERDQFGSVAVAKKMKKKKKKAINGNLNSNC